MNLCDLLGQTRQGTLLMIDNLDELVLLLLRTSGIRDAVVTYEEETGASHAEATSAVRGLARQNRPDHRARRTRNVRLALATAVTMKEE
jgi:hypothetical protein